MTTPGPWTDERQDEENGDIYWAIHSTIGYEFIANVYSNAEDAALIASAPGLRAVNAALVEALELFLKQWNACGPNSDFGRYFSNVRVAAEAALAKGEKK